MTAPTDAGRGTDEVSVVRIVSDPMTGSIAPRVEQMPIDEAQAAARNDDAALAIEAMPRDSDSALVASLKRTINRLHAERAAYRTILHMRQQKTPDVLMADADYVATEIERIVHDHLETLHVSEFVDSDTYEVFRCTALVAAVLELLQSGKIVTTFD